MCKFCEAMESYRKADTILKKHEPDVEHRYSVAIVQRVFFKGRKGCQGRGTDYQYRGCGYKLNFCPECGRKLTKKSDIDGPAETP